MRKIAIILSIIAVTAMLFSSCGKYEEGPAFSLATKKARLTGDWTLKETSYNGVVVENLSNFGEITTITYKKDGTGSNSYTWGGFTVSSKLEWEFSDDKSKLRTRDYDSDSNSWNAWEETEIIRLTNKELWTKDVYNEGVYEGITITKYEKK